MKVFKYIIGTLAALYALAQCVQLIRLLTSGNLNQPNAGSFIFGVVAGICIGAAIAFLCFRRRK